MVDAVVGSVIMVVATTSLLFSIEISEKAYRGSGYQPLSPSEEGLVNAMPLPFPDADSFESSNSGLFGRQ